LGKKSFLEIFGKNWYLLNMKFVISETQRNNLIEGIFLSDEEKKQRLEKSIKLSKDYSRPRQFALEHPKLWAWLRAQNLVDVVFPNRQKYRPDGYWTIDTIGQESTKYNSRSEFERGNQWAYEKARKLGILDALFPTRKTTYDKKM
jgi:hypothetical protein